MAADTGLVPTAAVDLACDERVVTWQAVGSATHL
jgi:hypothetical protein